MKSTILGVLRLLLCLLITKTFYDTFKALRSFEKFSNESIAGKTITSIMAMFAITYLVYNSINAIRQILKKRIRFKPMFVVIGIMFLLFSIVILPNFGAALDKFSLRRALLIVVYLLQVYFLFYDFKLLFKHTTNSMMF